MELDFNLNNVRTTEFGIGIDNVNDQCFCFMAVDSDVQGALHEMTVATWNAMNTLNSDPPKYEASEKHESQDCVYLPLNDDLARQMRQLHEANNLTTNSNALEDPTKIFCYFARLTDVQGKRLTALRRATQFKGALKSRFIAWKLMTDALRLIEDKIFRLDNDFDLLIDASYVHILRPNAFEFVGKLQEAILAAVPENIRLIRDDLPFVSLDSVQEYAINRPRAARHLASIRCQEQTRNIDKTSLKELCISTGVGITEIDDKIVIQEGHVMGFLEVLDRRRYQVKLVRDSTEIFKATARQKIDRGRR